MSILQQSLQNAGATENPAVNALTPPAQPSPTGAEPAPQGTNLPAPNPAVTCPAVKAHMDEVDEMIRIMDQKQRAAFERVVVAGKKMLYAPQSAEVVQGLIMDDDIPMKNKLGEGVANLLVMMDNQGNGTIPKDILVPAGVVIMLEAADYVFECGFDVSEEDLAGGLEILIYGVFDAYGIPRDKVDAFIDQMGEKMGFKEGDGDKMLNKVEEAQEAGVVREPIPGDAEAAEEAAFEQGFKQTRGM